MLDLLLMGGLGLGAVRGYFSGGTRQLVSTVGWLFAFVFGASLMGPLGNAVVRSLGASERMAPVLGFVVTFGLMLAAVGAVGYALRKTLEAFKLGGLDRLIGSFLGGFKAALGLSLFLLVTGFTPFPGGQPWLISAETREASVLYEPVRAVAPATWRFVRAVAPGVQRRLSDKFRTWEEDRRASDSTAVEPLESREN
ncbi:MAG TPA: CvpA family protein [Rubricoccaceae bacterium]|nr:CvpA family protein [Rubricoccaceae bacterium]